MLTNLIYMVNENFWYHSDQVVLDVIRKIASHELSNFLLQLTNVLERGEKRKLAQYQFWDVVLKSHLLIVFSVRDEVANTVQMFQECRCEPLLQRMNRE